MSGRVATWRSPQLCWMENRGRESIKVHTDGLQSWLVGYIRYEHFRALVKWDCILWSPHQSWCYSPHVMSHTYPRASIWGAKTPPPPSALWFIADIVSRLVNCWGGWKPHWTHSLSLLGISSSAVKRKCPCRSICWAVWDNCWWLEKFWDAPQNSKEGSIDFISISYCFQNLRVDLFCCLTWFRITLETPFWVFLRG